MEGECESDERDEEVYVGNGFVCFRVKRIERDLWGKNDDDGYPLT